ncbi:(d)CMP kinase [Peptoniphilus sp. GNH]|nr:(d)CMP kinase [Peptoniphilus sp. GNH]
MVFSVAIDGKAGVGKSTVARLVAKKLNITYVNTGSMYRAIGLKLLLNNVDIDQIEDIDSFLKSTKIKLVDDEIFLDGENVTEKIRDEKVGNFTSKISQNKKIREYLVYLQQEIAKHQSIVMEGRDIGSVVLKNSKNKFYLTASAHNRALRRYDELKLKGLDVNLNKLIDDMAKRDYDDTHRKNSPLVKADDAFEIATDALNPDEVAKLIVSRVIK